MKPQRMALLALVVIGITLLGVLLLNNKQLCDVSFRSGGTEIVAHMAYETSQESGGERSPPFPPLFSILNAPNPFAF
ncbi:hypothetical protein CEW81_11895 [Kluyvera genomosp. 3]|uniref:Hok/Gef family protein n=1 Tax=Kluyvera genomosp. 3 TaxID=2774055 RepID=A0A248KHP7_9ENTR|nr:hypothetical protein CEW81_11895 [Kluyvera genomosp. 3]